MTLAPAFTWQINSFEATKQQNKKDLLTQTIYTVPPDISFWYFSMAFMYCFREERSKS